jgi:hypothetical protein
VGVAALGAAFVLCAILGVATAPALDADVRPAPPVDTARPDITILVTESYLNESATEALPGNVVGEATLDVRPNNQLLATAAFDLLLVDLEVLIDARVDVREGRIAVWVESIEAGSWDVMELIGVDQFTLGEDLTDAVQEQLEEELGEGAQLLDIVTDEEHVILNARWE